MLILVLCNVLPPCVLRRHSFMILSTLSFWANTSELLQELGASSRAFLVNPDSIRLLCGSAVNFLGARGILNG